MSVSVNKFQHELCRTVRFCVDFTEGPQAIPNSVHNSFAGWPAMLGLGAYYELEVCCRGEPDPQTGYLLNISRVDEHVRSFAVPLIRRMWQASRAEKPEFIVKSLLQHLQSNLEQRVSSVCWRLTPYYSVMVQANAPDQVVIIQQFEFCAAHRLHVPELSDEQNRALFGKCNNPNGHGHNYRLEVRVAQAISNSSAGSAETPTLQQIEKQVDELVVQRFDHKHLNIETEEFKTLNPSVENIARVCFELLHPAFRKTGLKLLHVTIWETEKTKCTYPAM